MKVFRWLLLLFGSGLGWAVRNPAIIVLVFIISFYNHFFSGAKVVDVESISTGAAAWSALVYSFEWFTQPHNFLLSIAGMLAASAISMFSVGVTFALFSGSPSPWADGARELISVRLAQYLAIQTVANIVTYSGFVVTVAGIVHLFGMSGKAGLAMIALIGCIFFAVYYMFLSTCAVIAGARMAVREKFKAASVMFTGKNLKYLLLFYVIRIGAESLLLFVAAALVSIGDFPRVATSILVIGLLVLPFATVRTSGFILKFRMLKDFAWFSSKFRAHYVTPISAS